MKPFHNTWGMICLWVLGFLISSCIYAKTDKFDLDDLVDGEDYTSAIEQLDSRLQLLDPSRDAELWTTTLLQGARLRALQSDHKASINYLQSHPWPDNTPAQIILKIGVASEIEHYLDQTNWSLLNHGDQNEATSESHVSDYHQQISDLNQHYQSAFKAARQSDLNLAQLKTYLTESQFPEHIRGKLADLVARRWMEFLIDDLYWSATQQKQVGHLDIAALLDLQVSGDDLFDDTLEKMSNTHDSTEAKHHPLLLIKNISADLFEWHDEAGRKEAAFEVVRHYTTLLNKHFSTAADTEALMQYLSGHVKRLSPQYPWWTMGQHQLALFRQQMPDKNALLEAHDLAVKASIAHPESMGAIRSQQLLSELEYQEFSVSGQRSSGLGQASLKVNYRNLYRLYFRAWRVNEPLPKSLSEEAQRAVVDELLKQPAEVEWVSDLTDNADLTYHEVQLVPKIDGHGQWLLMASPQAEFADVPTKLQLLNLHFSHYVASAHYLDGEFRVAVYDGLRGRAMPNITAELLRLRENKADVLEVAKTDVHGVAILPRKKDAEHYQIRLRHGVDSSVIEIPGLLPLRDEKRWSSQPAKAVILTNQTVYAPEENVLWTMLVKAEESIASVGPKALSEQSGWIKLYGPDNQLIDEQALKTDSFGIANGLFKLAGVGAGVGEYRIESSWDGRQLVVVEEEQGADLSLDHFPSGLLANQRLAVSGSAVHGKATSTAESIEWQLRRMSYFPNGDLHSMIDVANGRENIKNQRFSVDVVLSVEDKPSPLRHRFELYLDYQHQGKSLKTMMQRFSLTSDHEYFSIISDKAFFEKEQGVKLTLSRTNSHWGGVAAQSKWFVYKLISSNKGVAVAQGEVAEWLVGPLQQNGQIQHDVDGRASLHLQNLDVGVYRLRLIDKNNPKLMKQSVPAELDFIVVQSGQANRLEQANVLLAQKAVTKAGETLKLLAGSGVDGQWVRLNILKQGKAITSQMLSPGVHLLEFPISAAHQGGLSFNLEWVEQNQIYNKDILVSVPWDSKQLQLAVSQEKSHADQNDWILKASDYQGSLIDSETKVLVYYSEDIGGNVGANNSASDVWADFSDLYQQSNPSMIRLDNNGASYPYYFRGSRHIASSAIPEPKHPEIRYSDKNNDHYLGKDKDFDMLPMLLLSTERAVGNVSLTSQSMEPSGAVKSHVKNKPVGSSTQYLQQGALDEKGAFKLIIPQALSDKKVRANILLVGPDLQAGQLSVILR